MSIGGEIPWSNVVSLGRNLHIECGKTRDNNAKNFHRIASARGNNNFIACLQIGKALVEDRDVIKSHVVDFFITLIFKP